MSKTETRRYWVRTDEVLEGQEKEWSGERNRGYAEQGPLSGPENER